LRIYAGGYGIQSLIAVALFKALKEMNISADIVTNGLAGFYAAAEEILGEDEAMRRTMELLDRIDYELYMIERRWICEGERVKGWKSIAVDHCVKLALQESFKRWEEIEDLLMGLEENVNVGVEYIDLYGNIGVYYGNGVEVSKISLAMTGVFPPFKEKFSTTHFTQIPVYTARDGDIVLVNFRDPSKCVFEKADEILSQSAEIRAIVFAKQLLSKKKVIQIHHPPMDFKDLADLESIKSNLKKELGELI